MLKLKHLIENYPLVKMLLSEWSHDLDELDDMLKQFRISSNAVYPFKNQSQVQFLRFAPVEEKSLQQLLAEREFMRYLQGQNFMTARHIPSHSGEDIIKKETPWGTYYASVFSCAAGRRLDCLPYSKAQVYEYGKSLGQLHCLSKTFTPTHARWHYNDVFDWMAQQLKAFEPDDKLLRHLNALKVKLSSLPQNSDTFGLVHYDYEPDNIFYDEAKRLITAIDFDDSMYHFYALDIEQSLAELEDIAGMNDKVAAENTFILGYQSVCPLNYPLADYRPMMRQFIDLYKYTRILYAMSEEVNHPATWMDDLKQRLYSALTNIKNAI